MAGSEELLDELVAAYQAGSVDDLRGFLEDWREAVPALGTEELGALPPEVRTAYEIYRSVYRPRLGARHLEVILQGTLPPGPTPTLYPRDPSLGRESAIDRAEYYIVQSCLRLEYHAASEAQALEPFLPPVDVAPATPLHLVPRYGAALVRFLAGADSRERADFLNQLVPIMPGQWGGWHVATGPNVTELRLEGDLRRAEIAWRVGSSGGESSLEKRGRYWVVTGSWGFWIE
ncbi:MAG: hypothetical protein ACE5EL_05800 [Anaerolineae bacterium]